MKRLILTAIVCLACATLARAGDDATKQTLAYLQKLQTANGGFRSHEPKPDAVKILPTLRATSAAARAIHYFGGEVPNKDACIRFVESCHDSASGGFSDTPKGKPDVFSTAVGLMAVTELKMPKDKYAAGAIKFLSANAKAYEDVRIAAAGLEQLGAKSPQNAAWIAEIKKSADKAGLYGNGPGQARDTGGKVVTLLRLGDKVDNADAVLQALKKGQRQNGGYGKADSEIASDLETTYRVLRCFVMLKARPDRVEGVRSFIAKCRNADGGYGVAPGQPSSVGGTYFAGIMLHWLKQ